KPKAFLRFRALTPISGLKIPEPSGAARSACRLVPAGQDAPELGFGFVELADTLVAVHLGRVRAALRPFLPRASPYPVWSGGFADQELARDAKLVVQGANHRQGQRPLAAQDLVDPVELPNHGHEVLRPETRLLHAELERLHRIGK